MTIFDNAKYVLFLFTYCFLSAITYLPETEKYSLEQTTKYWLGVIVVVVVVVVLLFFVHGKHLRSCRDGQLT